MTKLLDLLEMQGALLPPSEETDTGGPQPGPSDERSLVVREILDSERKYMQDLEVLQVSRLMHVERTSALLTLRSLRPGRRTTNGNCKRATSSRKIRSTAYSST